ncbi:MAG: hypothetical protein ABI672_17005 [Vicinamibacteria bacterium]
MSNGKDETLSQISEVSRRGPNWDGFGSAASHPQSIRRARVFWLELLGASTRVTSPAVATSSNGSVSFVWSNGLEIHIPPTGPIFSVRDENGNVRVSDLRDIVEAVELIPKLESERA